MIDGDGMVYGVRVDGWTLYRYEAAVVRDLQRVLSRCGVIDCDLLRMARQVGPYSTVRGHYSPQRGEYCDVPVQEYKSTAVQEYP